MPSAVSSSGLPRARETGPYWREPPPQAPPRSPPSFRWARNVGPLEPAASSGSRTELCWHGAALGGGRVWRSSAARALAPAPRFPASLTPAGPRPWRQPAPRTATVLLARARWARPTAAAAPGGLPPRLGDTRAPPGPAAAALLMPSALCSAGRLSATPSRC